MTRFAVWMPPIHGEANVIGDKRAVARESELALCGRQRRRKERVSTLGTEKVLLMVSALPPKLRVIQRDEALFHDCRFAAVASWGKVLFSRDGQKETKWVEMSTTDLVVIQMAVGLAIAFVAAHMLQKLVADCAAEALGMPAKAHRIDDAASDGAVAPTARKATALTGGRRLGGQGALRGLRGLTTSEAYSGNFKYLRWRLRIHVLDFDRRPSTVVVVVITRQINLRD